MCIHTFTFKWTNILNLQSYNSPIVHSRAGVHNSYLMACQIFLGRMYSVNAIKRHFRHMFKKQRIRLMFTCGSTWSIFLTTFFWLSAFFRTIGRIETPNSLSISRADKKLVIGSMSWNRDENYQEMFILSVKNILWYIPYRVCQGLWPSYTVVVLVLGSSYFSPPQKILFTSKVVNIDQKSK